MSQIDIKPRTSEYGLRDDDLIRQETHHVLVSERPTWDKYRIDIKI